MAQRKSKNTLQVNRPVSFNLCDPDQKADYDFTLQWFNFSGKIKQWIRAQRLGRLAGDDLRRFEFFGVEDMGDDTEILSMDEGEALESMF